jgi:mono/diheme cytochrome c family protein
MTIQQRLQTLFILLTTAILLASCGGDSWVDEHGYGPVTEPLELGEIDEEMAIRGEQIFDTYCESCHAMNASISGPALGRTLERRTPEFVMNYTLNPRENRQNHPVGRQLSDEYSGVMSDPGINEEQARAVLEYMRKYLE